MTCDLCDGPARFVAPVFARLRNDAGDWVEIIRMCQPCASTWYGWADEPVAVDAQPFLTTEAQFANWLQLASR